MARFTGLELVPANAQVLADLGTRLRHIANAQFSVHHPQLSFFSAIDAVEFHDPVQHQVDGLLRARTAATFGERTIDRSPCGTGTCARMAVLHARGELKVGQRLVSESIIGTRFIGQIIEETQVGEYQAIVPQVTGQAFLTGFFQFVLDPEDPFPQGFSLDDNGTKSVHSAD